MFEKPARILTVDKIIDWNGHASKKIQKPSVPNVVTFVAEEDVVVKKVSPKRQVSTVVDSKVEEILWIV